MSHPGSAVIETAHLFRPLLKELLRVLRALEPTQWDRPTSAGAWTVKDVVAHLLDGDLRRLSAARDGYLPPAPEQRISSYADLLAYLNALNAEWVAAARRLSPRVLCDQLAQSGAELASVMEIADPWSSAIFPVAWIGEGDSPMWMDVGREYTERWHHQDQIREAVGEAPLRDGKWLRPALEISLLALPNAYRAATAPAATSVHLEVHGEAGGDWQIRFDTSWTIAPGRPHEPVTTIRTGDLELARLLMHRMTENVSRSLIVVEGDAALAAPLLQARAVMV